MGNGGFSRQDVFERPQMPEIHTDCRKKSPWAVVAAGPHHRDSPQPRQTHAFGPNGVAHQSLGSPWPRRTPGQHAKTGPNPNGVPQRAHGSCMSSAYEPMRNPVGVRIDAINHPGVRRDAATPGFVVKPVPD